MKKIIRKSLSIFLITAICSRYWPAFSSMPMIWAQEQRTQPEAPCCATTSDAWLPGPLEWSDGPDWEENQEDLTGGISDATESNAEFKPILLIDDVNPKRTQYRGWQADSPEKNYNYSVVDQDGEIVDQTWWNYTWDEELEGWQLKAMNVESSNDGQEWEYCLFHSDGSLKTRIPAEIDGKPVVSLYECFMNSPLTRCPELPSTIKSLDNAFSYSALEAMPQLPEGITSVKAAFEGCANLSEVTEIPASVTCADQAFYYSGISKTPDFADGSDLEDMVQTFANCKALEQTGIFPQVEKMTGTFQGSFPDGFDAREKIKLPDTLTDMENTFAYSGISFAPRIPPAVKNMDYCFQACGQLKKIPLLPEGLESAQGAFRFCSGVEYQNGDEYVVLPRSLINGQEMFSSTFGAGAKKAGSRRSQLVFIQSCDHYQDLWGQIYGGAFNDIDQNGDYILEDGEPVCGDKEILTTAPTFSSALCVHDNRRALRITFQEFYPKTLHTYLMDTILYQINGGGFTVWDRQPVYLTEDSYLEVKKVRTIETYEGEITIEGNTRGKWFRVSQPETPNLSPKYLGKGVYEVAVLYSPLLRSLNQVELYYSVNGQPVHKIPNGGTVKLKCGDKVEAYADWGAIGDSAEWTAPPYVQSVEITGLEETYVGMQELLLFCQVETEEAGDKTVLWSLEEGEAIARIENGALINTGYGMAAIKAEAADGGGACDRKTIEFKEEIQPSDIRVRLEGDHSPYFTVGEQAGLEVEILPEHVADPSYTVSIDDTELMEYENGRLTAQRAGEVIVTVTAANGLSKDLTLWVNEKIQGITAAFSPPIVDSGQSSMLTIQTEPMISLFGDSPFLVEFKSGQLDPDKIKAIANGNQQFLTVYDGVDGGILTAQISLRGQEIPPATADLTIRPAVNTEYLSINPKVDEIYVNEQKELAVEKSMASESPVYWKTDSPKILSVDENGVITGIRAGKAEVTVYAESIYGFTVSDSIMVEVKERLPENLEALSLSGEHDLNIGEQLKLSAVKYPDRTTAELTWESSREDILMVVQDGTVTGISPGTAIITVKGKENPQIQASVQIRVLDQRHSSIKIRPKNHLQNFKGQPAVVKNSFGGGKAFFTADLDTWQENKAVNWSVENLSGEGTITQEGVFTPVKNGTVIVRAAADCDESVTDSFELAILTRAEKIEWDFWGGEGRKLLGVKRILPSDAMIEGMFLFHNDSEFLCCEPDKTGEIIIPQGWEAGMSADKTSLFLTTSAEKESPLYYQEPVWDGPGSSLPLSEYRVIDPKGNYRLTSQELEAGYRVEILDRNGDALPSGILKDCEPGTCEFLLYPQNSDEEPVVGVGLEERDGEYYLVQLPEFHNQTGGYLFEIDIRMRGSEVTGIRDLRICGNSWCLSERQESLLMVRTLNDRLEETDTYVMDREIDWDRLEFYAGQAVTEYLKKEVLVFLDIDSQYGPATFQSVQWDGLELPSSSGPFNYSVSLYEQSGEKVTSYEVAAPVEAYSKNLRYPAFLFSRNGNYRIKVADPQGRCEYRDIQVSGLDGNINVDLKDQFVDSFGKKLRIEPVITTEHGAGCLSDYEIEIAFPKNWEEDPAYTRMQLEGDLLWAKGFIPDGEIGIVLTLRQQGKTVYRNYYPIYIQNQTPYLRVNLPDRNWYETEVLKPSVLSKKWIGYAGIMSEAMFELGDEDLIFTISEDRHDFSGTLPEGMMALGNRQFKAGRPGTYYLSVKYSDDLMKYYTEEELELWKQNQDTPVFTVLPIPEYAARLLTPGEEAVLKKGEPAEIIGKIVFGDEQEDASESNSILSLENLSGKAKIVKRNGQTLLLPETCGYIKLTLTPTKEGKQVPDSAILKIENPVNKIVIGERNNRTVLAEGEHAYFYVKKYEPEDADPFEVEWHTKAQAEEPSAETKIEEDGILLAGEAGKTDIFASVKGKQEVKSNVLSMEILPPEPQAEKIEIIPAEAVMKDHERLQFQARIVPENLESKNVLWKVKEDGAAITADGIFIPQNPGIYHVEAALEADPDLRAFAVCEVRPHMQSIKITNGDTMNCESSLMLEAEIDPEDTQPQEIEWSILEGGDFALLNGAELISGSQKGEVIIRAAIRGSGISDTKRIAIGKKGFDLKAEICDRDRILCPKAEMDTPVYLYVNRELCTDSVRKHNNYEVEIISLETASQAKGSSLDSMGGLHMRSAGGYQVKVTKKDGELEYQSDAQIILSNSRYYEMLKILPEDGSFEMLTDSEKKLSYELLPELREEDKIVWETRSENVVIDEAGILSSGTEAPENISVLCKVVSEDETQEYLRQICVIGVRTKDVPLEPGQSGGGNEKAEEKPEENPEEKPEKKPEENPEEKPEKKPEKNPEVTPDKKPDYNSDKRPGDDFDGHTDDKTDIEKNQDPGTKADTDIPDTESSRNKGNEGNESASERSLENGSDTSNSETKPPTDSPPLPATGDNFNYLSSFLCSCFLLIIVSISAKRFGKICKK